MSVRSLLPLLAPKSVAVIGASDRQGSVGHALATNLCNSTFQGDVYLINPKRDKVLDRKAYKSIGDLPAAPDLAVVCTPASTVHDVIKSCGEKGVKSAIVLSAGFRESGPEGKAAEKKLVEIARHYNMRIIGPNCLGVISPGIGLNASFTSSIPGEGRVAFISQSGALGTAALDLAKTQDIGLSYFVSVGNMADVDFADLIDFFGQDAKTRAILLYIESITDARSFISAARAFTRTKPIIACKSGRFAASASAASSHTGAMIGADDVHEAAFRRAGIVRVKEFEEIFDCAALLEHTATPRGERLAIITNAGGPGVMATDALIAANGSLAELSAKTVEALNKVLPPCWSHNNPVDVLGDADDKRYVDALDLVMADDGVDAMLVILTPQAMTDPKAVAQAVVKASAKAGKPVLAAWMGGDVVAAGARILTEANIPCYPSPERAIRGFMHLVNYGRNIRTLYETPQPVPEDMVLSTNRQGIYVRALLSQADTMLSEIDSKELLDSYGIPIARAVKAGFADEAAKFAEMIGYPVAVKLLSPDISHKSDAGGVALHLTDAASVKAAFERMTKSAREQFPKATILGVNVQPMVSHTDAVEMIVGAKKDPVFGSVVMVGMGGVTAEVLDDHVLGLPPLTEKICRRMLSSLQGWPLLNGFRGRPKVNVDALIDVLIRFSYLVADSPNLKEFDINPLIVSPTGAVALDARAKLDNASPVPDDRYSHLAIRPYPAEYDGKVKLADGTRLRLRPIRPSDEPIWMDMLRACSPETLRARFFATIKGPNHEMATRYCFTDYDREIAVVALTETQPVKMIGVGRLAADADRHEGEFALLVIDEWQGKRVGSHITRFCLQVARQWGLRHISAETLIENKRMAATMREFNFQISTDRKEGLIHGVLELKGQA